MMPMQSGMMELGTIAPAFELLDVVSGRAVGRDDVVAMAQGDDATDGAIREGLNATGDGKRGLLVMFVCVHCPYVKHVEAGLTAIGRDYAGKIGMVAISSNDVMAYPEDGPEGMKQQAERLGFPFPYLYDETQEVAREYGAVCTPELLLFDKDLKLVYRGQMDDSRPRRGDAGNDIPVTGKDLRAAMDAVIKGVRPETNQKASIGCSIKWRA
ncbi:MAG: thioredoxin family protein [Granulicella sp.]